MATILFPSEPFQVRTVDESFSKERAAAKAAGFKVALVDHTRVTQGELQEAVSTVPHETREAVYRGWMLTPQQYQSMFDALAARGARLLTTPRAYRTCHLLPESYPLIEGRTPTSTWGPVAGDAVRGTIERLVAPFGKRPVIVKDYVKSQKHYWKEACFIPDASKLDDVERVVRRFLELQGDDLNVGLVFREFVPLRVVGTHPQSGMPLAAEFRIFWAFGEPLLVHRYWADLVDFDTPVPTDQLRDLVERIPSPLFTMDVALLDDGGWVIVELGDGQVAGLPSEQLAPQFYLKLAEIVGEHIEPT